MGQLCVINNKNSVSSPDNNSSEMGAELYRSLMKGEVSESFVAPVIGQ